MKLRFGLVLAVWTLLFGLAAIPGSQVSAQGQAQQTAAQRCFERHQFGAQPVDVAKTTDGQTVLAQTSWNWHDSIGCYLTLDDDDALAALRAAPHPQTLPDAPTDASRRCFEHHKFGENPVDVAKTADGQTVLARLSWGYHSTFGCYLVLDDTALTTLRTAHTDSTPEPTPDPTPEPTPDPTPEPTPNTDDVPIDTDTTDTDDIPTDTDTTDTEIPQASPRLTLLATGVSYSCAIRTDQTIACWGNNQDGQIDAPHGQYTTIAVGDFHSCAIRTDQTITCWGNNDLHGYTGQADAPHGQYTAVAVGGFHSCAIRTDQTITCWGLSEYGIIDAPEGQYTAIAAGNSHSCAITTDQTIACWGNNRTGQTDAPPGRFAAMAIGDHHSCAIGIKGSIACWGSNRDGQADAPPGRYTAIAVGDHHSCAIKTDQTIACWGNNWQGLADAPEGQYTAIAAGDVHTCAIRTDQAIACWGNNQDGQADAPSGRYTAISASAHWHGSHSCAIGVDQSIACWGYDQDGESSVPIRLRTPPEELLSVQVFSDSEPQVKAGGSFEVTVEFSRAVSGFDANDMNVVNGDVTHFSGSGSKYEATVTAAALGTVVVLIHRAAALDQDGRSNEPSQPFARTVRTVRTTASVIATASTTPAIATGDLHSCAIKADQTIACWGDNQQGQDDAPEGQFTAIAAGNSHSCAIKTDQTITCWGSNWQGQADAPEGQFTAIAAGNSHSCAITTDQTITCWGTSCCGLLNIPPGNFTTIASSDFYSCAIRTDQTITCWGTSYYVEDGDGYVKKANAPADQHTAIAVGETHSCAIRTDQTITCWGHNENGQTDAPAGQFTAVAAGGAHSCAIRTDQTITCWGDNRTGQVDVSPGTFVAIATPDDEFFDTWDRDAVRASASAEFHRKEPSHDWTGDIDKCVAGTTSQPYRDSIFLRVNWYRQMAGLNPVVERQEFSDSAQHAALIMAAEGSLSHSPPADWACYTPTGHEGASNSNLYLGVAGTSSIDGYIRDPGGGNVHVGHRRWILNPKAVEFGTGDIPIPSQRSNALYVVPRSGEGSSKTREERGFIAWPPPGYFPPAVNWGRWSFFLSDAHYPADFSTASVEVSDEFGTLETEVIYRESTGIVWGMHGNADDGLVIGRRPLHNLADSNYCYTVTISGVKINDSVQTPYEYAVCVLTR